MNNNDLYNSRIIKNYVEYLRVNYPDIDIDNIIDYAKLTTYQMEDEGHWFTQEQIDRFHEIVTRLTNNPNVSREVGRYSVSSKSSGAIKQYLIGCITPIAVYTLIGKIASNVTRGHTFQTISLGADTVKVAVTPKPGVQENIYQCENRIGTLEAIAKLFTGNYAKIDHPTCIHREGKSCVYIVTWEKTPSLIWKRIRNYAAMIGLPICIALWFFIPPLAAASVICLYLAMVSGMSYYSEHTDRLKLTDDMINQGDTASRLLDQINISYNNTLLVQEIGQATSMILDIDQLLAFIIEALEKRLDFDRGMIMLANRERTRLLYTIGYGYNPEQRKYLENIEFHLDNPDSRGAFVVSFQKQIPFLINDLREIEKDLSRRSIEFAKRMGTHSFICVPIIFKKESLGILVVDNIQSKRLFSQSDMNLLMGIAPQIAISINNAISYRKIQESEKRFRSLSETAPDIIYTIDTRGAFTYINPAWERILGHPVEDVLGRYFIDFVRKEAIPLYIGMFKHIRDERGTVRDAIGILLHKNGSDRSFSISGAPNFDSDGRVIGVVGIFKDVTDLKLSEAKLQSSYEKLKSALDSTIQAISKIVESRDPFTSGHQERVARLAAAIAGEMGLSGEFIASIRMAATLHDVGKINVPAEILSKPSKLSPIEIGMIRIHPEVGHNILKTIDFPYPISQIVLQHHERMDGSGYPAGMSGENILLEARILSVADVVEAMASHRPYRPAFGIEKALEEISLHRGTLYDEQAVSHCLELFLKKDFRF
ncbi:MAG: PAS domain S-box protein [Deltaproteobacteria bacterium]|nr:PAS domain S-box protein [Deltaproteobacteria bacterium]